MQDDHGPVAVIGAGIMGHGIAQALASYGIDVRLSDQSLDIAQSAKNSIAKSLTALARNGDSRSMEVSRILARIQPVDGVARAVAGAVLVIEAVPEVLSLKRDVWRTISRSSEPGVVLATNTSSFDIDLIAAHVDQPSRFLGTHWYNPPYLVPCVEVVRGAETSDHAVQRAIALLTAAGKSPVTTANRAGFVGNRLQFALIAEAFRCLQEGVATAVDIDRIVTGSFGMRLGDYGPFRLADMGGLDTYRHILDYLAKELGSRFEPSAILDDLVSRGRLGLKSFAGIYDYGPTEADQLLEERDARLALRSAAHGSQQVGETDRNAVSR